MITELKNCRICGNPNLAPVLDLGEQMLTGVFPRSRDEAVTSGPLRLVKCDGEGDVCGLLQLAHSYDLGEMYGDNYGYRSGLNASMVAHLQIKVERVRSQVVLNPGDLVIDIGSNDGTTLRAYDQPDLTLVGIDPTGLKFREFYPEHTILMPEFFSGNLVSRRFPGRKAKVVTSFSMFYDLPDPMQFMHDIQEILADDGIWVLEQSYMPLMLDTNSYDTVCHEHLEFYCLQQIQWMAERVGLRILDVEFNNVNGGSFSVTVGLQQPGEPILPAVQAILDREIAAGLQTLAPYDAFAGRVAASRDALRRFVETARLEGKRIGALGASTKGNVLLQYCGFTPDEIVAVGEVNPDKFGALTPGTFLPIVSEDELLDEVDYLLVLPWHFRAFFERSPKFRDATLVYPLPELSISAAECRLDDVT